MADVKRPTGLRRHLIVALIVKLFALAAIWWFFFRPELRPPADSAAVAAQLSVSP